MDTIRDAGNLDHLNLLKQIKVLCSRVQMIKPPSAASAADVLKHLASHMDLLQQTTASDKLAEKLSRFSQALQFDTDLAACFLIHFFKYVESALDLEENLDSIKEIINCFLPCIHVALKSQPKEQALDEILKSDLSLNLYKCAMNTFKEESLYQEGTSTDMLEYQNTGDRTVKAHVVRVNQEDSKRLFQETFGDSDNIASLYLIYVWKIYMIYEIRGGGGGRRGGGGGGGSIHSSIHDLTQVMEKSGKYIVVVPDKDMKKMALTDPFSPAGRYHKILMQSGKIAARHPIPELDFEWTDFCIGLLHPNGVVFLTNSASWQDNLEKISSNIEDLEVKRFLRYSPALGSTFALPLKACANIRKEIKGLSFIRVRVVRVAQAVCRVYGVDTGSCHRCRARDLVLLPAAIRTLPPCGRLARLPVLPAPAASSVLPALSLATALIQHSALTPSLTPEEVWHASLWLQVAKLSLPVLHLLKALVHPPACEDLLPAAALVAADYLQRLTEQRQPNQEAVTLLISILTVAMHKSSKLSLVLAKRGVFPALCEAALTWQREDAWMCIKALLGRQQLIRDFLHHHSDPTHLAAPRRNLKLQPCLTRTPDTRDTSTTVMELADITAPDYSRFLKMDASYASPQLASYRACPGKLCSDTEEVLISQTTVLERGHHLGVKTDLTHHLLQERNVSSLCSETLLQIILGMLNTHLGGKIYIGLNQFGVVQGVKMTRDQQDCFLLGFCKVVTRDVWPSLLPCDSAVHFVPVVHQQAVCPQAEFAYVIILTVQPEPQQVYAPKEHPEILYMREGGVTLSLHGPRHTEVLAKSQLWSQELEQQVKEEKQAMLQLALSRNHQDGLR